MGRYNFTTWSARQLLTACGVGLAMAPAANNRQVPVRAGRPGQWLLACRRGGTGGAPDFSGRTLVIRSWDRGYGFDTAAPLPQSLGLLDCESASKVLAAASTSNFPRHPDDELFLWSDEEGLVPSVRRAYHADPPLSDRRRAQYSGTFPFLVQ
jgi:predicted amidohydrolase